MTTTTAERSQTLPRPTTTVPEVDRVLRRLGLGPLRPDGLTSFPGRNDNWAGTTESGSGVFVKRIDGPGRTRLERALSFEHALAQHPETAIALRSPRYLGGDEHLMVFELLDTALPGSDLADRPDGFGTDHCHRAGRMLAALHAMPPTGRLDRSGAPFVPLRHLRALPLDSYLAASRAELQAWSLLQKDQPVAAALDALAVPPTPVRQRPVHGDLRLDQFLVRERPGRQAELYLTDWEEFRMGDPARDVGSFAGEWLYRAVMASARHAGGEEATRARVMESVAQQINDVRPRIIAFCQGYLAYDERPDNELPVRATAFAGWHLYDRMLAAANGSPRLGAYSRAAAGIGRQALVDPRRFTGVVGLDGLGERDAR
jgi:Ser/Thr protein kinase RdoA (MazF antagonist)